MSQSMLEWRLSSTTYLGDLLLWSPVERVRSTHGRIHAFPENEFDLPLLGRYRKQMTLHSAAMECRFPAAISDIGNVYFRFAWEVVVITLKFGDSIG
jgi:hypothetical protein